MCCAEKAASALTKLFLPESISGAEATDVRISKPYNDLVDQGKFDVNVKILESIADCSAV